MPDYRLPNHPSLTSQDPLGICRVDEEAFSHFALLRVLLQKAEQEFEQLEDNIDDDQTPRVIDSTWIKRFGTLLQDIAYSLHGDGKLNTDGLQSITLEVERPKQWHRDLRSTLFDSALQLETLYPTGVLPRLSPENSTASFSPSQMDCLLAHMLLGTLQTPPENTWGRPSFSQYFDGKIVPAVPNTAIPYLETILLHFAQGGYTNHLDPTHNFIFTYSTASEMPDLRTSTAIAPTLPVTVVAEPTDPSPSTKDGTFVLVAANAEPGPGAGGTHEERLVGQSPALSIASLLAPLLPADAAVITSPLPIHSTWKGHGRTSKLVSQVPSTSPRPSRRYIIADAIPLDLCHKQPSLLPRNTEREVRKLYAAFKGARETSESLGEIRIEMPPWGCGAFGGSLKVKMPCMMIAAGLAGLGRENLELLVPEGQKGSVWYSRKQDWTVKELYEEVTGSGGILSSIRGMLSVWK